MPDEDAVVLQEDPEDAQAEVTSTEEPEGTAEGGTYEVVTLDEARVLLQDVAKAARQDAMTDVQGIGLSQEQYDGLRQLMATELNGMVCVTGLLALILGAVIATAITVHWHR